MIRSKLLAQPKTLTQYSIIGLWYANALAVLLIWSKVSLHASLQGGPGAIYVGLGQLLGLAATLFALTQFLLMGRMRWLERHFGLDHLASYHRLNGYYAIIAIVLHPIFITVGYALNSKTGFGHQYIDILFHYNYVLWAALGELFFVLVVLTSIYLVRKHLQFENWYYIHLITYSAIVLVFFHQFSVGQTFSGHPAAKLYWYAVYALVALNVVLGRFIAPLFDYVRFGFRVAKVVPETATTTSIYIKLRQPAGFAAKPGQFILIRFLDKQRWWQEHPFSLSDTFNDGTLRLTVRASGDYTKAITSLKAGTPAIISGPFGRFTDNVAQTKKRLFIAGGVGITPIRPLISQGLSDQHASQLIYANRSPDDVALSEELATLEAKGLQLTHVYSAAPAGYHGETGYVDIEKVGRLSPDFLERDVYLCGPPVMMDGLVASLLQAGLPPRQLHFERFALHA